MRLVIVSIFFFFNNILLAQQISGYITNKKGDPVENVQIILIGTDKGTTSSNTGFYELQLIEGAENQVIFKHIQYYPDTITVFPGQKPIERNIMLTEHIAVLDDINISGSRLNTREQVSLTKIDPMDAKRLTTPFGEFNKILATLPGVVSNNEFSSAYSVRGGNFDENLVYVNDIPVYRPFLIRAGQQEGLSFVNTDLVESVSFSSGGWEPKYGDKLSSVLNIQYKTPDTWEGSLTASLLNNAFHVEGTGKNKRAGFLLGGRYKNSRYLLNTLEVEGEYFPRFIDVQSYLHFDLNKDKPSKTTLGILTSVAQNRYQVIPEDRTSDFGTFNQQLRLFVAFDGLELLRYDTYQGGAKLQHIFNNRFKTSLITGFMSTREREYFDVEAGYRLCDVDKNLDSETFDECVQNRGIGTIFQSARNQLDATVINLENRSEFIINSQQVLEFGVGYMHQEVSDYLNEYEFEDSVDFVEITENIKTENDINVNQYFLFAQHKVEFLNQHVLTYGLRTTFWDYSDQLLFSPRLQYAFPSQWNSSMMFKWAIGLYQQPPFYREFRDFQGNLNEDIEPQKSLHLIAGMEYDFFLWNRPFKITSEAYYKRLWDIIPYDVDNVRVRYYANNDAFGYATGLDFRMSGEFIRGTESWFSLGLLSTQEDVEGDDKGYIPRPSQQVLTASIFFQDHFPNNPSLRVSLAYTFGSGLPFGPPNSLSNRNQFPGKSYNRADVGFSKMIFFNENTRIKFLKSLWLGVEVLNLLGAENPISYFWVEDIFNNQYGVPNTLSARFLNAKLIAEF